MSASRAAEFERAILGGDVVVFPSDTVYGLACDPESEAAVERLYELKGRAPEKAAAVMFFTQDAALEALPQLGERTRAALRALTPGGVTLLLPNPARRFPLACGADPGTLGVRVVDVPVLRGVRLAVLQSSANPSGGEDARTLAGVAPAMRAGAGLLIDGGELPGVSSTVVDLRTYEADGRWQIARQGLVESTAVAGSLDSDA
jgi:L-threonylcarbamoyladenylate synthase